jgi:hypothetical protein
MGDKPILFNPGKQTVKEGEPLVLTIPIQDADLPDDHFIFSDNSDFFDINETSGEINWTPCPDQVGDHVFGITVVDRFGYSTIVLIEVLVENVNNPPSIISSLIVQAVQDEPFVYVIEADDPDLPFGDFLTYWAESETMMVDCESTTGTVSFVPSNGNVPTAIIVIRVRDAAHRLAEAELVVEVANINDPPYLEPLDPGDVLQGNEVSFQLLYGDPDMLVEITPPETLALGSVGHEAFAPDDVGNITFVPDQALVGTHEVTYTVTDAGGMQDSIVVTWNILNVNDNPLITTDVGPIVTATEDVAFSLRLEAIDIDDDEMTWTDDTPLFIIHSSDGLIEFTPLQNDVGTHRVTITVTDINGGADTVTFDLVVENVNDAPLIGSVLPTDGSGFKEDEKVLFSAEATDEDGDELSYSWFKGERMFGTGPSLEYSGLAPGKNAIRLVVSDGEASVDHAFNLTVEPQDDTIGPWTMASILCILVVIGSILASTMIVRRKERAIDSSTEPSGGSGATDDEGHEVNPVEESKG